MDLVRIINDTKDIEYAEHGLVTSNSIIFNPSEQDLLDNGYRYFANNTPEHKEGHVAEIDHYEIRDDNFVYIVYRYVKDTQ